MADINLKDEKRISVNGEYDLVTTHPNNEPIFRSNGHQLNLSELNEDYIEFNDFTLKEGNTLNIKWIQPSTTNNVYLFGNKSNNVFIATGSSTILIRDNSQNTINLSNPNGENFNSNFGKEYELELSIVSGQFVYKLNKILGGTGTFVDEFIFNTINSRQLSSNYFEDLNLNSFKLGSELFNPTNINENAQIEGSSGTIAQINSSAADPINYILGTVFQKSGFALVGDGSTQKIVSPLGGEIILTSTPLEGGFNLDGKTYNLTEGLGNVIKSTDGTTESDIVGFSGTSLNFGGWLKGDNINGRNPYTV